VAKPNLNRQAAKAAKAAKKSESIHDPRHVDCRQW
jgi:hypothetical protein